MTADRDCELRDNHRRGRILIHTCRGIKGYSGGPILVSAGGGEMQIAGIQIGIAQRDGTDKMIAVPAQAIWQPGRDEMFDAPAVVMASNNTAPAAPRVAVVALPSTKPAVAKAPESKTVVAALAKREVVAACGGPDDSMGQGAVPLEAIYARMDFIEPEIASSILEPVERPTAAVV